MSQTFSDGQSQHNIAHLAPFTFQVVRPAEGTKAGWKIDVEASFSWHCFTREPEPNEDVHKVRRGRELRCFCPKRYSYSFKLPEIIKELANRKVSLTGKGNYIRIELIDEAGEVVEYAIYFQLSKTGKKRPLKLFVESAYVPEDGEVDKWKKKNQQPVAFRILAYNLKHGKNVRYRR